MKNQKSLQPPAECYEKTATESSSFEESMQQWLDQAQNSGDVRDRIAVAGGVSRGVFGSLHLGQMESAELESDNDDEYGSEQNELRRAA